MQQVVRHAVSVIGLAAALSFASIAQGFASNQNVQAAIEGFVRPAYAAFAQSTQSLRTTMDALCDAPSQVAIADARRSFAAAVASWSAVETIRFGPVTEANRLERILYWPDRKGIGLRQVQAAIADRDVSATDPKALAGKSVAVQGFGALEFVLFGTGADTLETSGEPYRCTFGSAIAQNLAGIASEISAAWNAADGFAAQWANPGANNRLFRTDAEATTELVDILIQGLEMVRDVRLGGFLGEQPASDKPRQALFWRSQNTLSSITANIEGLRKLFDASGMAETLTGANAYLGPSIDSELGYAAIMAGKLGTQPVSDMLKDTEKRRQLEAFRTSTSSLSEFVGERMTGALGLSSGFSSLDGD